MRAFLQIATAVLFAVVLVCTGPAFAHNRDKPLEIRIFKSTQTMRVVHNGTELYVWKVSTGELDSYTPTGVFGVQSMDADHISSKYENTPMPSSIFYDRNWAIHGTLDTSRIGEPASMGCTHLEPENALILYELVEKIGKENVAIVIES